MKLFFAGDFCSRPSTSQIAVDDELKGIIKDCDFAVVNFEVPLKPQNVNLPPQSRERFFQNDDAPDFLRAMGFNLFSIANNHAFDWEDVGFRKTKAALGDNCFGAGTYDEAYQVKIVESKGVKIGFLALCFAAYKGVFDNLLDHSGLGCAFLNDHRVNHIILESKKIVDYLFVLPHEGIEYIDIPMPETIAKYRDFIDFGADGVIASHPHCPQGWEEYKGKPIFYSLGNFFFNSKKNTSYRAKRPHWYEGRSVVLNIDSGHISWDVINTKNRDNIAIEIDNSHESLMHSKHLCELLKDDAKYRKILKQVGDRLGYGQEMSYIDVACHQNHLWKSVKSLVKCWVSKVLKKDFTTDPSLVRLFKHDARRSLLTWAMILNEKNHLIKK